MCDLEEFQQAHRDGLILGGEAHGAARGLAELTGIIGRGDLTAWLARTCPIGPLDPLVAADVALVPLPRLPLLSRASRVEWLAQAWLPVEG